MSLVDVETYNVSSSIVCVIPRSMCRSFSAVLLRPNPIGIKQNNDLIHQTRRFQHLQRADLITRMMMLAVRISNGIPRLIPLAPRRRHRLILPYPPVLNTVLAVEVLVSRSM